MSEGHRTRKIVARVIVALLLGIATGYGIGTSLANDAARGRALTMKEYVGNFDDYKNKLLGNGSPLWAAIVAGVLMVVVAFAIYELLVWLVDKLLAALDRRRGSTTDQPG
jgi:predicted Na+-dependent transporter